MKKRHIGEHKKNKSRSHKPRHSDHHSRKK